MPDLFPGLYANGYPANIPSPNNADPGDATYLLQMASAVADRTAWLKYFIDTLMPGGELRGLTKLPTLAFLRSYAGAGGSRVEGDLVLVVGYGVYAWFAAATDTAADPFVVTPTAVGGGAGRWILIASSTRPPHGLIAVYPLAGAASHTLSSSDADVALLSADIAVQENDVLLVTTACAVTFPAASSAYQLIVSGTGTGLELARARVNLGAAGILGSSLQASTEATGPDTVHLEMRFGVLSGTASTNGQYTMQILHYRP